MIEEKFEYLFILCLLALTGLSLTWEGAIKLFKRRSAVLTIAVFFVYCLGIEVVALNLGWWSFPETRIVGYYLWIVPVEELLLFVVFSIVTLSCWEDLNNAAD